MLLRYCSQVMFREVLFLWAKLTKNLRIAAQIMQSMILCIAKRVAVNGVNSNVTTLGNMEYLIRGTHI